MKRLFILALTASSITYAEPRVLPPVIDNSSYPGGSAYSTNAAPSANAMYEVLGRLEQLQLEVQQLRGVVEEQSQTINDLKERQGHIYSDLDTRIQEITGEIPADHASANSSLTNVTENTLDAAPVVKEKTPETVVTQTLDQAQQATPDTSLKNRKELYQSAYETLRNGHNTRAIAEFKLFLTDFPKGEYSDNAQYWLAEAYKVNQDTNSAKQAFLKVISDYSNSPKVPDAIFKLGDIELEQKNNVKAKDYFTQLTVNYPGTTAAHLATKKLVQMGVIQP